ncbi:helix-turn-helix transcriptional regulator [bacterium]|nr:helix-turn-helix transcriptional regulator [bacterium]
MEHAVNKPFLPKRIEQARSKVGLSQNAVSEAVGVGPIDYSFWESGHKVVPEGKKPKLAEVLGVTIDWLSDTGPAQ